MSEKTPFIVLTVVFVVGLVGFILMYNTATTGMFDVYGGMIYGRAIAQEGAGGVREVEVTQSRVLRGPKEAGASGKTGVSQYSVVQSTGISVGQAYQTAAGEPTGNTAGIISTSTYNPKRTSEHRFVASRLGCYVMGIPEYEGFPGKYRPLYETTETLRTTEDCYIAGQEVTFPDGTQTFVNIRPQVMPETITDTTLYPWGVDQTACCVQVRGLTSTY